ncbi:MAG: tRNA pseudouridine(55) synthase TruB [Rickettsiales bacterium]|nr:tRNA pseudouridine(55) synthase TruB [Rickettsiales bacterium]|tara:strand:- start:57 stop:986 length:930 start_codon:yes stop_codon:yes gene_type:complete
MSQAKKSKLPKRALHGWLNIDKPYEMGSTDVVRQIKKMLRPVKVGHAGTLDPLASGILPIALGEATKTIPFMQDAGKTYQFVVKWGEATTTDDAEGEVCERSDIRPGKQAIEEALPAFTGVIQQIPPAYSAIKVNGKRAYDMARAGETVELQARSVHVNSFRLLSCEADEARFEVECGKGTYIRSLARDVAQKLGTCGHVTFLRRVRVGKFTEKTAISLDLLEQIMHSAATSEPEGLEEVVLSPATALDDIPAIVVDEAGSRRIRHGQTLTTHKPLKYGQSVALMWDGKLLAIGQWDGSHIKPKRVLNY